MKKTNMRIKDRTQITLQDEVNAIEYIADMCFTDGVYTPYYAKPAQIGVIVKYFLEGVELEEGEEDDPYKLYDTDTVLRNLIDTFFPISEAEYDRINKPKERELRDKSVQLMSYIMTMAQDKVNFRKSLAVAQVRAESSSAVEDKVLDILALEYEKLQIETKATKDIAKLTSDMEKINSVLSEDEQTQLMKNMAKSDFTFNNDVIASIVGDKLIRDETRKTNQELLKDLDETQKEYAKLQQKESAKSVLVDEKPKKKATTKKQAVKSKVTKITDKK